MTSTILSGTLVVTRFQGKNKRMVATMSMGAHTSMKNRRLPNLPGCFPSLIFPINGSIIPSHTLLISMMTLTQYMGMPTVSVKKGTNRKFIMLKLPPPNISPQANASLFLRLTFCAVFSTGNFSIFFLRQTLKRNSTTSPSLIS